MLRAELPFERRFDFVDQSERIVIGEPVRGCHTLLGRPFMGSPSGHDLSRQLIRVWVEKYETGGLDEDAQAAELLHEYETKIVALESLDLDTSVSRALIL